MARAIWKGSIAFGLVQIPVELHIAEEPDELSFRQLDKHDFAPIGYDRINKRTGKNHGGARDARAEANEQRPRLDGLAQTKPW